MTTEKEDAPRHKHTTHTHTPKARSSGPSQVKVVEGDRGETGRLATKVVAVPVGHKVRLLLLAVAKGLAAGNTRRHFCVDRGSAKMGDPKRIESGNGIKKKKN